MDVAAPRKGLLKGRSTGRKLFAVAAVVMAVGATATFTMNANAAVPGAPSGMTTVFSDDFTGAAGSGLNTAN